MNVRGNRDLERLLEGAIYPMEDLPKDMVIVSNLFLTPVRCEYIGEEFVWHFDEKDLYEWGQNLIVLKGVRA